MEYLNWSHFKPEFSGKSEDAEAYLHRTNNWMNAHHFLEGMKVQSSSTPFMSIKDHYNK